MIFENRVPRRMSWFAALGIMVAAVVVLPGWSQSQDDPDPPKSKSSIKWEKDQTQKPALVDDPHPIKKKPAVVEGGSAVDTEIRENARSLEAAPLLPPVADERPTVIHEDPPALEAAPMLPPAPSQNPPASYPQSPRADKWTRYDQEASEPDAVLSATVATKPKVIRTIEFEHRDALSMLQLVGAMMYPPGPKDGRKTTCVVAFTPAVYVLPPQPVPNTATAIAEPPPSPRISGLAPARSPSRGPYTTTTRVAARMVYDPKDAIIGLAPNSAPFWPPEGSPLAGNRPDGGSLRMTVDLPSNSLILRGDEESVTAVEELLTELDVSEYGMLKKDLPLQVMLTNNRSQESIGNVLRGLGIEVLTVAMQSVRPVKPGHGMFLVIASDSNEAMEIGKLIESLDQVEVAEPHRTEPTPAETLQLPAFQSSVK